MRYRVHFQIRNMPDYSVDMTAYTTTEYVTVCEGDTAISAVRNLSDTLPPQARERMHVFTTELIDTGETSEYTRYHLDLAENSIKRGRHAVAILRLNDIKRHCELAGLESRWQALMDEATR